MRLAEVEEMFGGAGSQEARIKLKNQGEGHLKLIPSWKIWSDNGGHAMIEFDDDGKTIQMNWGHEEETTFDKIRRWLHLQ